MEVSVQFWASDLFMQISVTEAEASRSEAVLSFLVGESRTSSFSIGQGGIHKLRNLYVTAAEGE